MLITHKKIPIAATIPRDSSAATPVMFSCLNSDHRDPLSPIVIHIMRLGPYLYLLERNPTWSIYVGI